MRPSIRTQGGVVGKAIVWGGVGEILTSYGKPPFSPPKHGKLGRMNAMQPMLAIRSTPSTSARMRHGASNHAARKSNHPPF